jgi:hypothetical protein
LQAKLQLVPSHVGIAFAGAAGHALQELPHEPVLLFDRQILLQACVPGEHWPPHALFDGMQAPLHSCGLFEGQLGWQEVPSQLTVPPVGCTQGVQEAPQESVLLLSTHMPWQRWKPAWHTTPQLVPSQVALIAWAGTGHGEHEVPQDPTSVLEAQAPWHTW